MFLAQILFASGKGHFAIHGRIEILVGIHNIEKVMRNATPFFKGGFGRSHVHMPVNLHGIGIYDLAPRERARSYGHSGFSAGRGTRDDNDFWFCVGHHGVYFRSERRAVKSGYPLRFFEFSASIQSF
jgi:hypothetical protein